MTKCEIFDRSDFHFLHHKAFLVGDFGVKYKLVTLNLGGTRHNLISYAYAERAHQFLTCTISACISSWHVRSVHASVPDAHAQCTHQFLTRKLSMHWRAFPNMEFYAYAEHMHKKLMRMLKLHISFWPVCSVYASVRDLYAQDTHQSLMRTFSRFWRDCAPEN